MVRKFQLLALNVRGFKFWILFLCLAVHNLILLKPEVCAQDLEFIEKHPDRHFEEETLGKDWGGFRSKLLDHGVFLELEYFGEGFYLSPKGRDATSRYFGILNMELHIDPELLFKGPRGQIYVFSTWMHGSRFQPFVGSIHDVSNIEARDNLVLMQFWYDLHFLEQRLSVLFGIYDIANEFDFRDSAQLFMNGSFGTGVDLTESADKGVPTYPLTALGLRLKVKPHPRIYFLTAFLDGVPNNPNEGGGTKVVLDADSEGFLSMNEIGYQSERPQWGLNKFGLGVWLFTKRYPDLVLLDAAGNPLKHSGTQGLYAFAEGTVYQEHRGSPQGLELFVRIGFSDKDVNSIATYLDGGLVYTGLLPGRDRDKFGIGISTLFFSGKFRQQQEASGNPIDHTETLLEATYRIHVLPGVYLQPDFQYVINPALRPGARDTLSVGLRFAINL